MAVPDIAAPSPIAVGSRYLYVAPRLDGVAVFESSALADTTERHHLVLSTGDPIATGDVAGEIDRHLDVTGVVVGLTTGLPDRQRLEILDRALRRGRRAWLYWPREQAGGGGGREGPPSPPPPPPAPRAPREG